jgi:hypothetical protein
MPWPGKGKPDKPERPKRHVHNWVHKRRSKPIHGRPYDLYRCEGQDGCGKTEERPV